MPIDPTLVKCRLEQQSLAQELHQYLLGLSINQCVGIDDLAIAVNSNIGKVYKSLQLLEAQGAIVLHRKSHFPTISQSDSAATTINIQIQPQVSLITPMLAMALHQESQILAAQAEVSLRLNDCQQVIIFYAQAAEYEAAALEALDPTKTRTVGIFLVSAVSLWCKANRPDLAVALIEKWQFHPNLPAFALDQIAEVGLI